MITKEDILIPDIRYIPIIVECINNLEKWGYAYNYKSINWSVAKMDCVGRASISFYNDNKQVITITLNQGLISQNKDTIRDTIYHELAHVIAGINDQHGDKWKTIVSDIRRRTGLPLKVSAEEGDLAEQYSILGYKFSYLCEKCGKVVGTNKEYKNTVLTHINCGGILKRII